MPFTIEATYKITDESSGIATAEGVITERSVSVDDMLAFEAAQIALLVARNEASIAKFKAKK